MHCTGFGQLHPGFLGGFEKIEKDGLLGVVGLAGVTRSRPDALVFFVDEFGVVELAGALDAPRNTSPVVKEFGEGFRKPISESLHHQCLIQIVCRAKLGRPFVCSVDAYHKSTEVVG